MIYRRRCSECHEPCNAETARRHQHAMTDLFSCGTCGYPVHVDYLDRHASVCEQAQQLAEQGIAELAEWMSA